MSKQTLSAFYETENLQTQPEIGQVPNMPESECNKEHMVSHRGKDYCSDKCADDHYNQKRRLANHAEVILTKGGYISKIAAEQLPPTEQLPSKINILQVESLDEEKWQKAMRINMELLNELELDPVNGSCFWINEFVEGIQL